MLKKKKKIPSGPWRLDKGRKGRKSLAPKLSSVQRSRIPVPRFTRENV